MWRLIISQTRKVTYTNGEKKEEVSYDSINETVYESARLCELLDVINMSEKLKPSKITYKIERVKVVEE